MFKLFMCAVCQVEIKPDEGISVHAGSSDFGKLRPWDGPFLCLSCQEKKEAMEGKRPSGGTDNNSLWSNHSLPSFMRLIFLFSFVFNFTDRHNSDSD